MSCVVLTMESACVLVSGPNPVIEGLETVIFSSCHINSQLERPMSD